MSITFDSYSEAREYQKKMVQTEQTASKIKREGGKFVVTLLEKKPVKIFGLTQKELEEVKGKGATGIHFTKGGEHTIVLSDEAGTGTCLHELGHARMGHENVGGVTFNERIDRELDAEIYAWQAKDKDLNPRVGWNAVRQAMTWMPGLSWRSVINAVSRKLEERGIPVTRKDKQWFIDTTLEKTDDPELEEWKRKIKEEF